MTTTTRLLLLAIVVLTVGCDRVTKHIAATTLAGLPGQSFLADTVRLEYTENTGAFLSLGANLPAWARTGLFTVGNGLLLTVLAATALLGRWHGWALVGVTIFVAGGASNLIDRLMHGSVIDFLNVGLGPLRTGIFNVADVAIMTGAALLVISQVRAGRADRTSSGPAC